MKTLVDIDEALLKEAMALAKAQTKKETIRLALAEYIRSGHRRALKAMAGGGVVDMTLSELRRARRQSVSDASKRLGGKRVKTNR